MRRHDRDSHFKASRFEGQSVGKFIHEVFITIWPLTLNDDGFCFEDQDVGTTHKPLVGWVRKMMWSTR